MLLGRGCLSTPGSVSELARSSARVSSFTRAVTARPQSAPALGSSIGAYLAHDVLVGSGVTVFAGVSIGGHCVVGDRVNIGMNARAVPPAGVHWCWLHEFEWARRSPEILPPHVKAFGSPLRIHGVNAIGLERRVVSSAAIAAISTAYEAGELLLDPVTRPISTRRSPPRSCSGACAKTESPPRAIWRSGSIR